MNNIYFLCSLPRAGNTLLGSIVNQSQHVKLTANTILTDIIYQLQLIKDYEIYKNFSDEKSLNNVINNVFNNYYQNWNVDNIIDRGTWGTPANLQYLKLIIEKPINVETRCHNLMEIEGMIGKSLWSIKNIIKEKENHVIIHYKNFIKNPNKEIKKMFDYLEIIFTNFNLSNLQQFSANNINYNDSIYKSQLHTIRTDKIELNKYKIEDYLPNNIIKQYSNLDIWKY